MSTSNIFDSVHGRNSLFTGFIALVLIYIGFSIPLVENTDAWYGGLYKDLDIPEQDRYNLPLVALEIFILTLVYFFTLVSLGSLAEYRNRLPSWGEVFFSGLFTLTLAFFFPRFSVGGGVEGTDSSTGFNHFTSSMQTSVFFGTLVCILLVTLYVIYTDDQKQ